MSQKNGIVHLWDLPKDKVFVKLPGEVQKRMIEIAVEITKKQKLQNPLNSYILPPRYKRGIIYTEVLKTCKELKDRNQRLTNKNIAKQLKKSESYVRQLTLGRS